MSISYLILGILAIVLVWLIWSYNVLVRLRTRGREAWSDIDVQLKRRYDLIPNLLETVKGYAGHEQAVFERVTTARAQALNAQSVKEKEVADNQVTSALKSIFAVAEAYPALRAVESFTNLQNELADTENKIQAARRFYNTNVRDLNIRIDSFPTNLVAKLFTFSKMDFFELADKDAVAREPVAVKF